MAMDSNVVPRSGLLELVGTRVPRIGYGTMRLTGPGVFGPPPDPAEARRVLGRALELGVRVFDTAWYYGPDIPNQLLAEATRPYADDLVAGRIQDRQLALDDRDEGVALVADAEQHVANVGSSLLSDLAKRGQLRLGQPGTGGNCHHVSLLGAWPLQSFQSYA